MIALILSGARLLGTKLGLYASIALCAVAVLFTAYRMGLSRGQANAELYHRTSALQAAKSRQRMRDVIAATDFAANRERLRQRWGKR